MRKQLYSFPLGAKIEAQLPEKVLIALKMSGWNAFGIYEMVKKEIAAEKRNRIKYGHTLPKVI
jgi:hypothetical protein